MVWHKQCSKQWVLNWMHDFFNNLFYLIFSVFKMPIVKLKHFSPGCQPLPKLVSPGKAPWLLWAGGSMFCISWPLGWIPGWSGTAPVDSFWAIHACARAAQSTWPATQPSSLNQGFPNWSGYSRNKSWNWTFFPWDICVRASLSSANFCCLSEKWSSWECIVLCSLACILITTNT